MTSKYFPGINRIEYQPNAGPEDTMVFKHYNPEEVIEGKTMEEWLKFAPCFSSTFRLVIILKTKFLNPILRSTKI